MQIRFFKAMSFSFNMKKSSFLELFLFLVSVFHVGLGKIEIYALTFSYKYKRILYFYSLWH